MPSGYFLYFKPQIFYQLLNNISIKKKKLHNNNNDKSLTTKYEKLEFLKKKNIYEKLGTILKYRAEVEY